MTADEGQRIKMVQNQKNHLLSGQQILVVEDCQDQLRYYRMLLEKEGAQVVCLQNGTEALRAVRRCPHQFDCLLVDFEMPFWDGIQTTRLMRQYGFGGLIIGFSANESCDLDTNWSDAGCDMFLKKPVRREQLLEALAKLNAENLAADPTRIKKDMSGSIAVGENGGEVLD